MGSDYELSCDHWVNDGITMMQEWVKWHQLKFAFLYSCYWCRSRALLCLSSPYYKGEDAINPPPLYITDRTKCPLWFPDRMKSDSEPNKTLHANGYNKILTAVLRKSRFRRGSLDQESRRRRGGQIQPFPLRLVSPLLSPPNLLVGAGRSKSMFGQNMLYYICYNYCYTSTPKEKHWWDCLSQVLTTSVTSLGLYAAWLGPQCNLLFLLRQQNVLDLPLNYLSSCIVQQA